MRPSEDPRVVGIVAELQTALREVQAVGSLLELAVERPPGEEEWLGVLARIGRHQAALGRSLGSASAAMGLPAGARDRILLYLLAHVGAPVEKEELDGVSGIQEWARRVRELRLEEGWRISTQENRDDLAPGQYLLESGEPDRAAARRGRAPDRAGH